MGILYFPVHSLAYFASEGGSEGVVNWADAGRELLGPLLDWSSADTVYRTYGKVYLVVVLGFGLGLIALRGRRAGEADGLQRWSFRVALAGYALLVVGAVVEYWTPYLDFGFLAFTGPGVLLALVGSTLLGITLLRGDAARRAGAWLLTVSMPLGFGLTALLGHLSAGLVSLELAWIVLGWWLWSETPVGCLRRPARWANR